MYSGYRKKISVLFIAVLLGGSLFFTGCDTDGGNGGGPPPPDFPWPLDLPSLRQAFSNYFLIGNIWGSNWNALPGDAGRSAWTYGNNEYFFRQHFNAITAEDYHKPDQIASTTTPRQINQANFNRGLNVAQWAHRNGVEMIGHTLIWHSQSPLWMTGAPGHATWPLVTRTQAMENMEWLIREWAGALEARNDVSIASWDVLNEVFTDGIGQQAWSANPVWTAHMRRGTTGLGANNLRWYDAFANNAQGEEAGHDFVWYAFYFARRHAPSSVLYYNDFNEEQPGKRDAIVQMVNDINNRWDRRDGRLLIEGIGMQSHHHIIGWATNFGNIPAAIQAFAGTGARVSITELDITYGGFPEATAIPDAEWTAEHAARQAEAFANVMRMYIENSRYIHRVSFWGLRDSNSWRRAGRPLLFDGQFQPKPAFFAVIEAAN